MRTSVQDSSPLENWLARQVPVQLQIDGQTESFEATIRGVHSGLLELSTPVYLKHDQRVEMVCEGRTIPSLAAFCRRQGHGMYCLAVRVATAATTRKEPRIAADIATTLRISGSAAKLAVRVVDLSSSGLGIDLAAPVPVGAQVNVDLGQRTAVGQVSHCARGLGKYRAGIWLEDLTNAHHRNASKWRDLNSGAGNLSAVAAFVRSVEERQSQLEAMLLSLGRSVPANA